MAKAELSSAKKITRGVYPEISRGDVEKTADLSRLKLTSKELSRFVGQLEEILEYVGKLKSANLKHKTSKSTISPYHSLYSEFVEPMTNLMREDKIEPSSVSVEELLANVPQKEDTFIRVPAVLGEREE